MILFFLIANFGFMVPSYEKCAKKAFRVWYYQIVSLVLVRAFLQIQIIIIYYIYYIFGSLITKITNFLVYTKTTIKITIIITGFICNYSTYYDAFLYLNFYYRTFFLPWTNENSIFFYINKNIQLSIYCSNYNRSERRRDLSFVLSLN